MALTPEQWRQTYTALWRGFDPTSFTLLVRIHLDQRLYDIAEEGIFPAVVAQVLDWCEEQGRVRDLIQGAAAENPTFDLITQLAREAQPPAWDLSPRPQRRVDSARPIPLERPARVLHFTGREHELGDLIARLQPGTVVTLSGPGGIGKTALASQAIWALAPKDAPPATFPDGIVFYSFYGRPSVLAAMEHIAIHYGEEAKPSPELAAQRALAGRTALLVLDGAEQADDLSALLNLRGNCCVLVTTRVHGGTDIEPLPAGEAAALLRAWAGKQADAGAEADKAVARICELVGNLPLAVRLAGAYMAECGVNAGEYLAWIEKTPLEALELGKRGRESVPLLLERSLTGVSEQARAALGVVGLLALQPLEVALIAAALGIEAAAAPRVLGELVRLSLLQRLENGCYKVTHALVHTFAWKCLVPSTDVVNRMGKMLLAALGQHQGSDELAMVGTEITAENLYGLVMGYTYATIYELSGGKSIGPFNANDYITANPEWSDDKVALISDAIEVVDALMRQVRDCTKLLEDGNLLARDGELDRAIDLYEQALVLSRRIGYRLIETATLTILKYARVAQKMRRDSA